MKTFVRLLHEKHPMEISLRQILNLVESVTLSFTAETHEEEKYCGKVFSSFLR